MNPENTLKQRKEINGNTLLLLITTVLPIPAKASPTFRHSSIS